MSLPLLNRPSGSTFVYRRGRRDFLFGQVLWFGDANAVFSGNNPYPALVRDA